jgi:ABC-type antimicrobial peptide transport system permease subunit
LYIVLHDRESYYLSRPENNEKSLVAVQKELNLKYDLISTAPVHGALSELYFINMFLVSTFVTIVFFMVLISIMLIYSLMIADVDEKTYEMGMLRALGLRTVSLFQLILIQSMIFSVPGIVLGIACSLVIFLFVRYYIYIMTFTYMSYFMSMAA